MNKVAGYIRVSTPIGIQCPGYRYAGESNGNGIQYEVKENAFL